MGTLRTMVCESRDCDSKLFTIKTQIKKTHNKLSIFCEKCNKLRYEMKLDNYTNILPNCCECNQEVFRLKKDIELDSILLLCANCDTPAKEEYVDKQGNPVDINELRVLKIEDALNYIIDKLDDLEINQDKLECDIDKLRCEIDDL